MKRILRIPAIIVLSAGFIVLILLLLNRLTPDPPLSEIGRAREALSAAGANKAGTYSRKLYNEALSAFDSTMALWDRENRKFIYLRNYDRVTEYARLSEKKARQAEETSVTNSSNIRSRLEEKLDTIRKTEASIGRLFGRYPLQAETRTRIARGKLLLREGETAFEKGQFLTANRKITDAEYLLSGVYRTAEDELRNYFSSYPQWKAWFQSAVSESKKNNSYSIIVDKYSRRCYLYLAGVKKYEFEAELGRNWVGDKRRSGDKATPEGMYRIVKKYQGRETMYHKALSIDYPNKSDHEQFRKEIASGTIPSSSGIGGGIEIHGGGGRGVDWTEGCVALTNAEIDLVYRLVSVGTPVTIVGSIKPIEEILKDN